MALKSNLVGTKWQTTDNLTLQLPRLHHLPQQQLMSAYFAVMAIASVVMAKIAKHVPKIVLVEFIEVEFAEMAFARLVKLVTTALKIVHLEWKVMLQ